MKYILLPVLVFLVSCTSGGTSTPGLLIDTGSVDQSSSQNKILKIQRTISGMAGTTELIFESGALSYQGYREEALKKYELSGESWDRLIHSFDLGLFLKLDQKAERFICKACVYDGDNMETIHITYSDGEKSISYGSQNDIKELTTIRQMMHELYGIMNESPGDTKKNNIQKISWGTSFGECGGYCVNTVEITATGITSMHEGYDAINYPKKETSSLIDETSWHTLQKTLDIPAILSLQDRIGCPDCADGGAEWIEIAYDDTIKRTSFEYGQSPSQFSTTIQLMQEMMKEYNISK